MIGMAVTNESCFDICLSITVNLFTGQATTEVQSGEACSGIDIDFERGLFTITLPLVACVEITLQDDLTVDAELVDLSLPGYF